MHALIHPLKLKVEKLMAFCVNENYIVPHVAKKKIKIKITSDFFTDRNITKVADIPILTFTYAVQALQFMRRTFFYLLIC